MAHTRERLWPLCIHNNTFFALTMTHRIYYRKQLSDVRLGQKLVQPSERGTAPAIALAILEIMRRDPGGTIALFPSDHHFRESSIFRATVDRALRLARICEDRL